MCEKIFSVLEFKYLQAENKVICSSSIQRDLIHLCSGWVMVLHLQLCAFSLQVLSCDTVITDRVFNSQISKEEGQQSCTLDFWRAGFGLFRRLINIVPWKARGPLRGKGVQEGWSFFNREMLKAEEQAVPYAKHEPVGKTG